jgi:RecJ-like exonuclease
MAQFTCYKCGGTGRIEAFAHIENGECFACGGSGKLDLQPWAKKLVTEKHPEWIIPEGQRATIKQWDYLDKLCGDTDTKARKLLKEAGAPLASAPYVSKAMISRAIDLARKAA